MDEPRPSRRSISTQLSVPPGGKASACLTVDELVAMADGVLPEARSEAVLAHVDGCATCAELVGGLGSFDEEPRHLGRYRLDRLLGLGGMGVVYEAWDPELLRKVAIKLVRPEHASEKMRARMLGEARALARVSHPNVVSVFDVGEHDGEIFVATELVDGETLATWPKDRGLVEIVGAWVQVARGLAAAHAEGVVHRDVKPANAMVGKDGRIRIGDFGIAYQLGDAAAGTTATTTTSTAAASSSAAASSTPSSPASSPPASSLPASSPSSSPPPASSASSPTAPASPPALARPGPARLLSATKAASGTGAIGPRSLLRASGTPELITVSEIAGTPAYMAPEQHLGKVDARSDQFSLCVALVEALRGRRPDAGDVITLAPPPLAAALTRGLSVDPDARFPAIRELADALEAAVAAPPAAAATPSTVEPAASHRRRLVLLLAALALVVVALAAVLVIAAPWRSRAAACQISTIPERIWSPARRDKLARAMPVDPSSQLGVWLAEWTATSADVCATSRAEPDVQRRRNRCLADQLAQLDSLLARWEAKPPRDALTMTSGLDVIPRPGRCSHAAMLTTPPPSLRQATELMPLRARMLQLPLLADRPAALAEAARLVERARALGYAPFTGEMSRALAALQAPTDRASARRTLGAASAYRAESGDSFEQVNAELELVGLLDSSAEAEAFAQSARKRLAALGGDRALEATLERNLAAAYHAEHQSDRALAALERARALYRELYGPSSLHEANVLVAIAGVYYQRDDSPRAGDAAFAEAGQIFKRAGLPAPLGPPEAETAALLAQVQQLYQMATASGARTVEVFDAEHTLASAYTLAEKPDLALTHYRRAVELAGELALRNDKVAFSYGQIAAFLLDDDKLEEALTPTRLAVELATDLKLDGELASALTTFGRLLLAQDAPVVAIAPLERALALRIRNNEPARFRGNTRFLLARALAQRDPKRALELAHAARADLQGALDALDPAERGADHVRRTTSVRLQEIDRWLRTR